MIRPIMSYACMSWAGGLNKKYLVRKLTKLQRFACLMISSTFLCTPTGALEKLHNITLVGAVRGSYKITVGRVWYVTRGGSFGKTKIHVAVCNEERRFQPLLQMPADRIKKEIYSREISNVKLWIK